jgi:hypothetical protein
MATLGPALEPGQIEVDSGLGNAEFNAGTSGYKFAHKLLQVYQLNNPVPLADMPDNGLGNGPPQKYRYVPPAIVGQLLANLRCPLFADGDEDEGDEDEEDEGEELEVEADVTISQELEEQLRSDIIHSTQMLSSVARHGYQEEEDVIPASQGSPTTRPSRKSTDGFARPPVPPTRSSQRLRNQNQTHQQHPLPPPYQKPQRTPSTARKTKPNFVRPSQATTASNPSSPSQEKSSLPASVPRPLPESSEPDLPELGEMDMNMDMMDMDMDVMEMGMGDEDASLGTQLLLSASSSQAALLLPDSLLVDEVGRAPEPVIWDSEDEGSYV